MAPVVLLDVTFLKTYPDRSPSNSLSPELPSKIFPFWIETKPEKDPVVESLKPVKFPLIESAPKFANSEMSDDMLGLSRILSTITSPGKPLTDEAVLYNATPL
jgi:hypothetical protein